VLVTPLSFSIVLESLHSSELECLPSSELMHLPSSEPSVYLVMNWSVYLFLNLNVYTVLKWASYLVLKLCLPSFKMECLPTSQLDSLPSSEMPFQPLNIMCCFQIVRKYCKQQKKHRITCYFILWYVTLKIFITQFDTNPMNETNCTHPFIIYLLWAEWNSHKIYKIIQPVQFQGLFGPGGRGSMLLWCIGISLP
jgi:hypothetical protein